MLTPVRRKPAARVAVCVGFVLLFGVSAARAQDCTDENYAVHPDLLQKAFDKAVEDTVDAAGKAALRRLKEAIAANPQAFGGLVPGSANFFRFLDNLPVMMKGIEAVEALAAADYKKLGGMTLEVGAQAGLAALGVPLAGEIVATFQIAKLSYDELKNQECLLEVDIAYYRFLEDPLLDTRNPNRTRQYLDKYIRGGGADPYGGDIATNRRRLQCYIDATLPADQRVDISTVAEGASIMNPFTKITDSLAVAADKPGLKTAVNVMLTEFNARRDLEKTRQQAAAYLARADYQALKSVLPALGNYPLLASAICDAYKKLVEEKNTGGSGGGRGAAGGTTTGGTGRGTGRGTAITVAATADREDPLLVSPGSQVVGFGDRTASEVDAWIPFKFTFSPPAGGVESVTIVLVVRPIGQLINTDTFHCLINSEGKGRALYTSFSSLPTNKPSVVKVTATKASDPALIAQINTGTLRCCVQDDTALFSGTLLINPPAAGPGSR